MFRKVPEVPDTLNRNFQNELSFKWFLLEKEKAKN